MNLITAIKLAEEAKNNGYLMPYPKAVILLAELYLGKVGKRERTRIEKQVQEELEKDGQKKN